MASRQLIDFVNTAVTGVHKANVILTLAYWKQTASFVPIGQQVMAARRLILTPLVGVQHLHSEAGHIM